MSKKYENMSLVTEIDRSILQDAEIVAALKTAGFKFNISSIFKGLQVNPGWGTQEKCWHLMVKDAGPLYADIDESGKFFIGFDNSAECGMIHNVSANKRAILRAIQKYDAETKRDRFYDIACKNPTDEAIANLVAAIRAAKN